VLWAQNPESPRIDFVSVDTNTQKPKIHWTQDNLQNIDGFLIKRFVYDFQNTYGYNTVKIIEDPYATDFIDATTVYGEALPGQRMEIYRVAAYDSVDDQRFLSPMSDPHATIFLSGTFDYCERSNFLEWTEYFSWENDFKAYSVFESTDNENFRLISEKAFGDTAVSAAIGRLNIDYRYYVEAANSAGFVSRSNTINISSETSEFPENITITEISNASEGSTQLKFSIDKTDAVESFVLLTEQSEDQNTDSLVTLTADGSFEYKIISPRLSNTDLRNFRIIALDTCPAEVGRSELYTELLSEASESHRKYYNTIEVLRHPYLDAFTIFRRFNNAPFEKVAEGVGTIYEDNRTENLRGQLYGELPQGFYYYRCEAFRDHTRYISNISSVRHEAKLIKYNAVNPKSNYKQDNEFKPFAAYLSDYKMTIYHPEGYVIFESTDPQIGWKGTLPDGQLVPRGTYIYYIQYTDASGERRTEKDYVTVVY
jgi:hypothetical protein